MQVSYDIGVLWQVYLCQSKLVSYGGILLGLGGVCECCDSNTFNERLVVCCTGHVQGEAGHLLYKILVHVFHTKRVRQRA